MDEHVINRLRHVLCKHRERLGGWTKLAEAIAGASDERNIDRRTLERICGDDVGTVQLRISQLMALDHFFVLNNEGPLLMKGLSPIDSIAESFNVNFLVAANYVPAINDDAIARWDLRALTCLMRTRLNELRTRIWDVTGPDNWREDDVEIVNSANVAIASPVANYAAEAMLARMVGIEPRKKCAIDSLPFLIIGAARDKRIRSAFVRERPDVIERDAKAVESLDPERRGIMVGKRVYVSTESRDYGMLIAQRDPVNGQVQMVLAGLTGQSTFQLAKILQGGEPACTLPPFIKGEKQPPILLTVYEFRLVPDENARGRNTHRIISYTPVVAPAFLMHGGGQWRFFEGNGTGSMQ